MNTECSFHVFWLATAETNNEDEPKILHALNFPSSVWEEKKFWEKNLRLRTQIN